jgi:histidinol dehydrogenase
MCCIPASVAGVGRICVASPPGAAGRPDAGVLAACFLAGVDEVYAVGGAQAIAALAFGTETIDPVDLIAGPGNRYVTEAKRLVWGKVGIDGFAGPTELMVVADGMANPEWIALDLCAQGEHGDDSPLIVASADLALLDRVAELVSGLVPDRPSVADATLILVYTRGLEAALTLADAVAPEHLELAFEGADETVARARVAGCVFVGTGGGAAFGDYAAGSNHVLPTGGAARFGGPLGPGTFRRRTSVVTLPSASASALPEHVAALARPEGFTVHGESAQVRARG